MKNPTAISRPLRLSFLFANWSPGDATKYPGSSGKSKWQFSCSLRITLCVNIAETSGRKIFMKLTSDEKLGVRGQEVVGKYSQWARHCCSVPPVQNIEHSGTSMYQRLNHNGYCTHHPRISLNTVSTVNWNVLHDYWHNKQPFFSYRILSLWCPVCSLHTLHCTLLSTVHHCFF